jgi:GNAT superfamily N-acetyltransferase
MEILQAKPIDLVEILYLVKVCIADMNARGLTHWNSSYPGTSVIQHDLDEGRVFLYKDKGVCKGMVTLSSQAPAEYGQLSFYSEGAKPLYLMRMAVHPLWQDKGIASALIEFAQQMARENGYDCIRLDVYQPSEQERQLCIGENFKEVGTFQSESQRIPYLCYEKQL